MRLARDTWRGLAALVDREHGLPVDHVRLAERRDRPRAGRRLHQPQHIGLWLIAVVAARGSA